MMKRVGFFLKPLFLLTLAQMMGSFLIPYSPVAVAADGQWTFYTTRNSELFSDNVNAMAVSPAGVKWFSHPTGGVSRFDGRNWSTWAAGDTVPGMINAIAFRGNEVWFAGDEGLAYFDGISWKRVFKYYHFTFIATDHAGNLWLGGRFGIRSTVSRYDGSRWLTWFIGGGVTSIAFDSTETLWVGTTTGLYRFDGKNWRRSREQMVPQAFSIAIDKSNVGWMLRCDGRGHGGVSRLEGESWTHLNIGREIYPGYHSLAVTNDNTVWLTSYDFPSPLSYRSNGQGWEAVRDYDDGLYMPFITAAADIDGSVWFCGSQGVGHYVPSGITVKPASAVRSLVSLDAVPKAPRITTDSQDWFPLSIGNTWIYKRTFSNFFKEKIEDRVVQTIIDTLTVNGKLHYEFLDGQKFRRDENGSVWSDDTLCYDFRPCGVYDCGPEYRRNRWEMTFNVPAGTFAGYGFDKGGWFDIGVNCHMVAAPVGIVGTSYGTDTPEMEYLELEYARINGREYGVHSAVQTISQPAALLLFPPSPNPFNPSTTITFSLPDKEKTTLIVYSISGQKVRTLIFGQMTAGSHSVVWDGRDDHGVPVSSGVYLARLESGKSVSTAKMLLMK